MVIQLKDFDKVCNDIMSDDFDFTRKLKVKTKTSEGVEITTEGTMSGDGSSKSILAKLSGSFKHSSGINFKKLQVTTHGRFIGEAEVDNVGTKGLKLTFKAEDGSSKNSANKRYSASGKVGVEYVNSSVAANTEADLVNNKLTAAAAYGYEQFLLGIGGTFDTDKTAVSDYNVGVAYNASDFTFAVKTKNSLNVVVASYDHKISNDVHAAATISHNIAKQTQTLTVGGKYTPDRDTTLKGKVDSEGIVSLALISKVSNTVKLTIASEIDAKNLEGDSHKFGLGVQLG